MVWCGLIDMSVFTGSLDCCFYMCCILYMYVVCMLYAAFLKDRIKYSEMEISGMGTNN